MGLEKGYKSQNFYAGTDYGFDPSWGSEYNLGLGTGYRVDPGSFALTTDPRSANQLAEVSRKLGTGAKVIEVQGVAPNILDSIPQQHFKEINRLKKLTGVDLTFHGPLVEPTGINPQGGGWDPISRQQSERQMWNAVERAHALDPDGNIVVTFHSSNGLPEPVTKVKDEKGKEIEASMVVIDERTGRFGSMPKPTRDHFTGEQESIHTELKKLNEQNWSTELSNVNVSTQRAKQVLEQLGRIRTDDEESSTITPEQKIEALYRLGTEKGKEQLDKMTPEMRRAAEQMIDELGYADVFVRDSYNNFKKVFNEAYDAAERTGNEEDLAKLKALQQELYPVAMEYDQDHAKVQKLADAVTKGIRVLDSIDAPITFKPMREFAIDKASETFSNVALNAYDKFGNSAPIISIENPPAGSGLSRAEDLRDLVKASRDKLK